MKSISVEDEERYLQQAIDIGTRLGEAFPSVPEYVALLASSRDKLGQCLQRQKQWQGAEQNFLQAADGMETLLKRFPDNRFYQMSVVLASSNLASLYLEGPKEFASADKLSSTRDQLQRALRPLAAEGKRHDLISERFLAKPREILARLESELSN